MKKLRFFSAAAATVLLAGTLACADPALPFYDMFDADIIKSLTWTEGTSYYDYVCYSYEYEDLPEYSYDLYACDLDMNPALMKKEGGLYFRLDPCFNGSFDSMVPCLYITCEGAAASIVRAEVTVGSLKLTAEAAADSPLSVWEEGTAELLIPTLGSNQITLISALEKADARPALSLSFSDGSQASCSFVLPSDAQYNPFVWLHRILRESRYLDDGDRLQESSRLLCAQNSLKHRDSVRVTLSGAEWIDDLSDSVRAYPLKLEYAPDNLLDLASFSFSALNYAGTFTDGSTLVDSFDVTWYAVDENGDPLSFEDGTLTKTAAFSGPIAPGQESGFSVTEPLPEGSAYVSAAISAFTCGGQKTVVPSRDLCFVLFQALPQDSTDL